MVLARNYPCGAINSVCMYVCLYVDSWAFCYGDVEGPDRVFLGVIGPGGLFFFVRDVGAQRIDGHRRRQRLQRL